MKKQLYFFYLYTFFPEVAYEGSLRVFMIKLKV
jgi:hypothetical protein